MYRTRVKICGIQTQQEATNAVLAGVDAIGFVFAKSSRQVTTDTVSAISTPPFVARVGVFVNASVKTINKTIEVCRLNFAQLHGEESAQICREINCPVIKSFPVTQKFCKKRFQNYPVAAYLFDHATKEQRGGTGKTFNWHYLPELSAFDKPVILAGGLNMKNIHQLLQSVKPFAVDVSSGVELNGQKNFTKMAQFVKNIS